jgi:hypothetical protein
MEADLVDGVLEWAKRQKAEWDTEIALLSSGRKTTTELRDGKIIDTTAETLAQRSKLGAELESLIARHENAKRS